jgi:hypothetical protein
MNSREIIQSLEGWVKSKDFSAPYGVLTGERVSKSGKKCLYITFGRERTLDATVEVYNRNFMVVRTSRHGSSFYRSLGELNAFINTL